MIKEFLVKNRVTIEKNINDCFDKSQDITKYLTNLIIKNFNKHYVVKKEVRLKNYKTKLNRCGIVDLRVIFQNDVIDIEVDRGNKINSIEKLNYSKKILGNNVLWIKWGIDINEKVLRRIKEYGIDFIFFHTEAHRIGRIKRRKRKRRKKK